jgi:NTP pyrophosphatase (non-canonical NTP hydrolase)
MNFAEYPALAARTEKQLPTIFARLEHAALGIGTEVGEIATPIKRIAIYDKQLTDLEKNGKTLLQNLAEEIGDVLWYLAIIDNVGPRDIFQAASLRPNRALADDLQVSALKSTSRRLQVFAGAISMQVEDLYVGLYVGDDPTDSVSADARGLLQELVNLAYLLGLDIVQIAADNIAKLRERFPDAYSNEAAEARADKGGLDARNS